VVNDPDPVPVADLDALRSASQPVLLDRPYLSNPAVGPSRAHWETSGAQTLFLDSTLFVSTGADRRAELFRHLSFVRAVAGPLMSARLLSIDRLNYTAEAKLSSGTTAILTCVLTDAGLPRAELRLLGSPHRLSMTIFPSTTARAATVSIVDAEGEVMLPTLYENGHRATWRRMLTCLANSNVSGDLDDFASDVAAFDLLHPAKVV
jgi:hypothetical protein